MVSLCYCHVGSATGMLLLTVTSVANVSSLVCRITANDEHCQVMLDVPIGVMCASPLDHLKLMLNHDLRYRCDGVVVRNEQGEFVCSNGGLLLVISGGGDVPSLHKADARVKYSAQVVLGNRGGKRGREESTTLLQVGLSRSASTGHL
jgi:hypothetical protein